MFPVSDCSPKAKAKIKSNEDTAGVTAFRHALAKYPFDQMHIGQCFTVKFTEMESGNISEGSLRLAAYKRSRAKKKFAVLKHPEHELFEVARIA